MNNIIAGKCALVKSQIYDRYIKGCKFLEIHTTLDSIEKTEELDYINQLGMKIVSIHTPFKNKDNILFGIGNEANDSIYFESYKKCINIASKYISSKDKIVVIHLPNIYLNSDKELVLSNMYEQIKTISEYATRVDKNICIVLENHMKYIDPKKNDLINFGYDIEPVKIVKNVNLPNIYAMLDICHALSSIKFGCNFNNISDFINYYIPYLKHIHLSNGKDDFEKNNHGTPFLDNKDDIKILNDIFIGIKDLDIPLVIEVGEKNMDDAKSYKNTYDVICKYFYNKIYKQK